MSRARRPPLRPLEEHVLGEVRDAARLARLVARAGRERDRAPNRLRMRKIGRQHAQAVVEHGAFERRHPSRSYRAPPVLGEQTRRAIAAQPEWLAQVPTDRRFPDGARLLFTGCGTSFHAAMTGGDAVQALELVLRPDRDADLLVLVSHEGETPLTLEAAKAWERPALARHRQGRRPDRRVVRRGDRLHAGDRGELVSHRELHVRGRGDRGAARRGHLMAARRRRRRARRAAPRRSATRSGSSSPAPGATSRPRTRRC